MSKAPPRVWLISDTHFNHDKLAKFGRPVNHSSLILKNWRHYVGPNDITFHLGDVIIGRDSELSGMLAQIPGRKILVMGNHDRKTSWWYMRNGFDFACHAFQWKDTLFTHEPVGYRDGCIRNIHGHLHDDQHRAKSYKLMPFNMLFALEWTNYKPVLLEDFITNYKKYHDLPKR